MAKRAASALVITLSCLVILSIIVVAFLSQAVLNRQLAFSSSGQVRAQMLAETATDLIVRDIRSEIAAGSDALPAGTATIYFPRTSAAAVPFRDTDATLTNLIRVSRSGTSIWSGTAYSVAGPVRSSQQVSTTNASANGRHIKAARWNQPYLLGTNLPAAFTSPDWFLITRGGVITGADPALATLVDRSPTNTNMAVGRFAYAIYDEGGLLDINVAGNALPTTNNAYRGRLHKADLTRIPGVLDPAALIAWRNAATASNSAWLDSSTNTFTTVHSGDQRFIGRQDFIKYTLQHTNVLSPESLSLLGTFTREKNSPTFRPASTNATNCIVPSVIRNDGKPVMARRFALGQLALVKNDATADTSQEIYKKFGLTRASSNDPWVYNHGNPAKILTLQEVASQNREPDFFEVLKAAIFNGSLAKTAGNPQDQNKDTALRTAHLDGNVDLQIIRIGANLIDQYDADSWPTPIKFLNQTINTVSYGVENLPYINRFFDSPFRPAATINQLSTWYEFEMWNPHQVQAAVAGPTQFRITALAGRTYSSLTYRLQATGTIPAVDTTLSGPVTTFTEGSTFITFGLQNFNEPTLLSAANATCDVPPPAGDASKIVGLFVGTVDISTAPDPLVSTNYSWPSGGAQPQFDGNGDFPTFALQYLTPENQWRTYQQLTNLRDPVRGAGGTNNNFFKNVGPNRGYYFRSDPRNIRFGAGKNSGNAPGNSMRGIDPTSFYPFKQTDGFFTSAGPHFENPGWTLLKSTNPTHARLAALANNDSQSSTSYRDFDGTLRIADGGLRGAADNPLQIGSTASRPVILNRPFLSVAEMGYAFRDEPWKTLNMFTTNSADAGLLDYFSLDESDVVAGKVNLNTRQPRVLESLLAGTARQEYSPTQTISGADASALASQLAAFTTNSPLVNKADLVAKFSPLTVSTSWPAIKTEREAFVRALAEAGNTRTWNLLIDLIVQVGRYPISAKTYADFNVEGERRYWLHLAIDRYTGEVIAQQMEAVNE